MLKQKSEPQPITAEPEPAELSEVQETFSSNSAEQSSLKTTFLDDKSKIPK